MNLFWSPLSLYWNEPICMEPRSRSVFLRSGALSENVQAPFPFLKVVHESLFRASGSRLSWALASGRVQIA
jgi:hypothetical protein